MLENDIYLNHIQLNIENIEDISNFMSRTLSFTGKSLKDIVLVLCAYSFYLTHEELSLLFPPIYQSASQHISERTFSALEKDGYLKHETITSYKEQEGTARTFYYVTAQGYQYANSLCHGKLTSRYKKNRSKTAKSHTYYIGYNFIQLLLLGYPITWQREYLISSSLGQRNNALQVDGKCDLFDNFGKKPYCTIYVEQDLGTEHNDILVGKLQNYAAYGLMDSPKDSLVLFSFSPKGVTFQSNGKNSQKHPYSANKCKELLNYMDMMHLDNIYDAYITGYPDTQFITSLLLKTRSAKGTHSGYKKNKDILSKEELEEFRQLLLVRRNPYQQKDYNLIRNAFCKSRLEEMIKLLFSHIDKNELFLLRIRDGYQIMYLPTTLVAERIRYALLSKYIDLQQKIAHSLSEPFEAVVFRNELSHSLPLTNRLKLTLRNYFSNQEFDIFFEFLCFDVGAWVRAAHFPSLVSDKKAILVAVFESRAQIETFYNTIGFIYDEDSNIKIYGIMLHDIGSSGHLFFVKDDSLKKTYLR